MNQQPNIQIKKPSTNSVGNWLPHEDELTWLVLPASPAASSGVNSFRFMIASTSLLMLAILRSEGCLWDCRRSNHWKSPALVFARGAVEIEARRLAPHPILRKTSLNLKTMNPQFPVHHLMDRHCGQEVITRMSNSAPRPQCWIVSLSIL